MQSYIVYTVKHDDCIIYVGRGCTKRINHVNSGTSHSYYLNKLHFSGIVMDIDIVKSNLTIEESKLCESILIDRYKPRGNIFGNSENYINHRNMMEKYKNTYKLIHEIIYSLCPNVKSIDRKTNKILYENIVEIIKHLSLKPNIPKNLITQNLINCNSSLYNFMCYYIRDSESEIGMYKITSVERRNVMNTVFMLNRIKGGYTVELKNLKMIKDDFTKLKSL